MKITKPGVPTTGKHELVGEFAGKCSRCGVEVEAEASELEPGDRRQVREPFGWLDPCPCCKYSPGIICMMAAKPTPQRFPWEIVPYILPGTILIAAAIIAHFLSR